jgi:hypothetical protein
MRQKSTEELLAIWVRNKRQEWTDEAFAAIQQALMERNVVLPPQEPPTGETIPAKYRGVRGWLLLFCVILTILNPLATLISVGGSIAMGSRAFTRYPGLLRATVIDLVLSVALMAFSIYSGVLLWRVRPGAVAMAKRFLLCVIGYYVVAAVLMFTAGLPASASARLTAEAAKNIIRGLIFSGIWYSYLQLSKRVRATYPS